MLRISWVFVSLMLSGCLWYESGLGKVRGEGDDYHDRHAVDRRISVDDARRHLAGRTWAFRPLKSMAPQIFHTTADGQAVIWSAREPRLLAGEWRLIRAPTDLHTSREEVVVLCFRVSTSAAAQPPGSGWMCKPAGRFIAYTRESLTGDVFGLVGRTEAPVVFAEDSTITLAGLRARLTTR
jgi:hypothetical protein